MSEQNQSEPGLSDGSRQKIASTLRWGGVVSFGLLLAGLALTIPEIPLHRPRTGSHFLHAGIISLLATPAARILAACCLYRQAGVKRYFLLSLLSLLVICMSIFAGLFYRR
jgi:uncharacterized membrane protein